MFGMGPMELTIVLVIVLVLFGAKRVPEIGASLGKAIREVILYSPRRRALRLEADHDEFRVGRMGWIYLQLLEQCSRAGVHWMPSSLSA